VNIPLKESIQSGKASIWANGVAQTSCQYAEELDAARWRLDTTYESVWWLKDATKDLY